MKSTISASRGPRPVRRASNASRALRRRGHSRRGRGAHRGRVPRSTARGIRLAKLSVKTSTYRRPISACVRSRLVEAPRTSRQSASTSVPLGSSALSGAPRSCHQNAPRIRRRARLLAGGPDCRGHAARRPRRAHEHDRPGHGRSGGTGGSNSNSSELVQVELDQPRRDRREIHQRRDDAHRVRQARRAP